MLGRVSGSLIFAGAPFTLIGHITSVFSFKSDSSLWFLCRCILNVYMLEHLYSHTSHRNPWSFSFFWRTFLISEQMSWQIVFFSIFIFTLSTLLFVFSLNCNLHESYHKVPTGNKGSTILTGITDVGSWKNDQSLNTSSFHPGWLP